MHVPQERHLIGLEYLAEVTGLLQRIRGAHPTAGLWEAADRQWSWRNPRSSDAVPQLFWFDDLGRPEAAVITTDAGAAVAFDPIVLPDASPEWVAHVVERGLVHAAEYGLEPLELEVDRADHALRQLVFRHGFEVADEGFVEAWLGADERPGISPLDAGYRLVSRLETLGRPHHMINPDRNHADVEQRLRQTSLYRPDLDLAVYDSTDGVAGYGLFWYDPATATGLVEPMRTEDAHQQRGIARHILTAGVDRLAKAGAARIKIVYAPHNPAASHLYLSVGFVPDRYTDLLSRQGSATVVSPSSSGHQISSSATHSNRDLA